VDEGTVDDPKRKPLILSSRDVRHLSDAITAGLRDALETFGWIAFGYPQAGVGLGKNASLLKVTAHS
jgi:hypothetical protein